MRFFDVITGAAATSLTYLNGLGITKETWYSYMKLQQAHEGTIRRMLNNDQIDIEYFIKNGKFSEKDLAAIYKNSGVKYTNRATRIKEQEIKLNKETEERNKRLLPKAEKVVKGPKEPAPLPDDEDDGVDNQIITSKTLIKTTKKDD